MDERYISPVDELSQLPLPIYAPPIDLIEDDVWTNRHHHMHPSTDLKIGVGSQAVRHVRIQEVPVYLHRLYHANFDGPPLPTTQREKYNLVVLAAAGFVPRQAIAFDEYSDEPYLTDLSEDERLALWSSKTIRMEATDVIKTFLLEYTMRHGKAAVRDGDIDEFLHTHDQPRRLELGRQLLHTAAQVATEPLQEVYDQARKERLITPVRSRQVGNFVCNLLTLGNEGRVRRKAIERIIPHLKPAA